MRKNILPRAFCALPVLMTCMACAVALETDFEVEKSFTKRSSLAKTVAITASVEEPDEDTKSALSGSTVVWKEGDAIKVFDSTGASAEFTLDPTCDGQTTGTFTGTFSGTGPFYAVYPYQAGAELSGTSVIVDVEKTQALTAGTFGDKANIAFAKANNLSDVFAFKNVLGAIKIQLTASTSVTDVRIETKGAESLWGRATIEMNGSGLPEVSVTNTASDRQIVTASGSATGTEFYVMVPPGAFDAGFVVHVMDNASEAMMMSASSDDKNKVVRSAVISMPAFTYTPQFKSAFLSLTALPFGYFSGINHGGSLSSFVFNPSTSQYANKVGATNRTFRVQDFSVGKMYQFVLSKDPVFDTTYSVSVESVVGSTYSAPASSDFKLIQKTTNAGWFLSSDNTQGFIILL